MQLPEQAEYATTFLKNSPYPVWFKDGDKFRFGPTQENSRFYVGPPAMRDSCAWRVPPNDFFAEKVSEAVPGFMTFVKRLLRCREVIEELPTHLSAGGDEQPPNAASMAPPHVRHRFIVMAVDVLACLFVCGFLMVAMFILDSISQPKVRIGTTGVLGIAFSVPVMLLAGPSRRIEVYAATAAFFAVASELRSR